MDDDTWRRWLRTGRDAVDAWNVPRFDLLHAFLESGRRFRLVLEDGRIDDMECGVDVGMGLGAVEGERTHFFSFAEPGSVLDELARSGEVLGLRPRESEPMEWQDPQERRMPIDRDIDAEPSPEKLRRVREADSTARARDDRIEGVRVRYTEKRRRMAVVDRAGWIRSEPQRYTSLVVEAIAVDGSRRERGHGRLAGYEGEEIFDRQSPAELAREAADRALTSLEAQPVEPGPKDVVIGPGFGGTIFHEACGHGFEADHIYQDVSQYSGRLGESVASEHVTFVDDGSIENQNGAFRFDDEGTPSSRTVLIRDGVMQNVLSDRKYAALLDREPTGNGRRQSFRHPILPRMTNTFIEAGDADPEAIVRETGDGIYAAHIGGGQVDPASGDFIFSITEGYRIENGRLTEPIRGAALVGNGPEVLNRIDAVGDDLELRPGVCGKGQWVPVTVGQPTLRVRDLTVGGEGE